MFLSYEIIFPFIKSHILFNLQGLAQCPHTLFMMLFLITLVYSVLFLLGNITAIIIPTLSYTVFHNLTLVVIYLYVLSLIPQLDFKSLEYRSSLLNFESSTVLNATNPVKTSIFKSEINEWIDSSKGKRNLVKWMNHMVYELLMVLESLPGRQQIDFLELLMFPRGIIMLFHQNQSTSISSKAIFSFSLILIRFLQC